MDKTTTPPSKGAATHTNDPLQTQQHSYIVPKSDGLGRGESEPIQSGSLSEADLTGQTSNDPGTIPPSNRSGKPPIILRPCPAPGDGVHHWIIQAAWDAKRSGLSIAEAEVVIRKKITRSPQPNEIHGALKKVYWGTTSNVLSKTICTTYSPPKLAAVAARLHWFGVDHLRRKSPVDPANCSTLQYLHSIYRGRQRTLVFDKMDMNEPAIWERNPDGPEYEGDELAEFKTPNRGMGAWFLANPVTGDWLELERLKSATNPKGQSLRAEENLTAWRFIVFESDTVPTDLWIRALVQLPLPIVSIVTSGGRSIHALVRIDARNKQEWEAAKQKIGPALVELGADKGALSAVRLTRLPGCFRAEKNNWQELLYLNPTADGTPICELPDCKDIQTPHNNSTL
jgi:hypothetical protein